MPTILLIRHGENDLISKCLYGRIPGIHLNQEGRTQAEHLAHLMSEAPLKSIYSSPLERAIETASPMAADHGLKIQTIQGLNELNVGELEGKSWDELNQMTLWHHIRTRPSVTPFPGGESFPDCQRRIAETIDGLAAQHEPDDLVACFTHGDIIRLAVAHYIHLPLDEYRRMETSTASITCLHFKNSDAVLGQFNQAISPHWTNGKNHHSA
jgi:broad specificity phosphatase PhoE